MKRRSVFNLLAAVLIVLTALAGTLRAAQGSGGPDNEGYIWDQTSDPGGPAYNFIDISTTGTALSFPNLSEAWSNPLSLGFSFKFYGANYTSVYVSPNGLLTFRSDSTNLAGDTSKPRDIIPGSGYPHAIIAGWWANLNPAGGGSVRWQVTGSSPNRIFIVQFTDVPHAGIFIPGPAPTVTFQFQLFEGSNNIEVHYKSMNSDGNNNTIGIENYDGSTGLSYSYGGFPPDNSTAIRYSLFVGLATRPKYQIRYGEAGTTLDFTTTISNWTGFSDTFGINVNLSGKNWPAVIDGGASSVTLDQGKSADLKLSITIPSDAVSADYTQADIAVQHGQNTTYTASATNIAAVPRRGYGLGYESTSASDAYTAIVPVDTAFHNTLGEAWDASNLGPFINYGTLSPDGKHLWVAASGETNKVFDLDPTNFSVPFGEVVGGADTSDVAFTPDGQKVIVSSYGDGNARIVDAATHTVIAGPVTTGTQSIQVATNACLPRKAYITNLGGTTVSVINVQTGTLIANIAGFNKPHGIAISPKGDRAYVANSGAATIGVIDTTKDTLLTSWNIGGSSMAGLDITPDGKYLYVASSAVIKVVDTSNGSYKDIASPIDNLWEVEVFPEGKGNFAYLTSKKSDYQAAVVVDTGTQTVAKLLESTWSPVGLALFPMDTVCTEKPVASFTYGPQPVRTGQAVTFTNTSLNAPTKYTWDFGDGSAQSNEEHPVHTYTDNGPFIVTLTAENANGTSTATTTINLAPHAIFTPTENVISAGTTINFVNSSTGTGTLTYTWDFGDSSATTTEASPSHTYTSIGDWTVKLTVTNSYGSETATGKVDFPPVAGFTPVDNIIQTGDTVTFTNSTTGTETLTYAWDFGDGTTSTDKSPSHQYPTAGSYPIKVTATNNYGTSTANGTVNFKPRAIFTPTKSSISPGGTVAFTDQSTGTGTLSYSWDFGDSSPASTVQNPTHTYSTIGDYTVTLKVTNSYGDDTTTGKVGFAPVAGFNQSATAINQNDTVTFTNTTTGTSTGMTYTWDFGDGSPTSSDASPSHQYTVIGNYNVTLTATNDYGTSQKTSTIRFVPVAGFTPTNNIIQTGDTINFANTSTGSDPITYTWNFGDGSSTSSLTSPSHQYTTASSYTVTLTAQSDWGTSQSTGTVVFRPRAAFTPTSPAIKPGDTVAFKNQSTGTAPLSYSWDFGDGGTSTLAEPTHVYATAGDYPVKMTVTNAQGSETATGVIHFVPTASFSPTSNVIHVNDSIPFTNNSTGTAPLSYSWDFGDNSPVNTSASPTHQYTVAGSYNVTLTVTNPYGSHSTTGTVRFAPTAAFSPTSNTIRTGDTISFKNNSTGTETLSYEWNFGDGSTSTSANPSHTYNTAADYKVTLKAKNTWGESTAEGTVVFAPRAIFTPTSSLIYVNTPVNFSNQTTGGGNMTYTWDFGDNSPQSHEVSPSHVYSTTGSFTVQLTATNGNGTHSTTGSVVFYATARFTADKTIILPGTTVHFTNTSVGTLPLKYTWDFGDGSLVVTNIDSPSHTYTKAGNYTVTLTADNNYNKASSATTTIRFLPTASFTMPSTPLRVGDTIPFTNTSTGSDPMDYQWNFGDSSPILTSPSPAHQFPGAGPYTVTLTAHNDLDTSTSSQTVVFAPTARFTPANTVIKLNQLYQPANQSVGTGDLSYTWNFGDGSPEVHEANPSHQYTVAGSYTVTLTAVNKYGTHQTTGTVKFSPVADYAFAPTAVFPGHTVNFTNHSSGTPLLSYTWDFGDGSPVSHEVNPSHIFGFGHFKVTLTVTNDQGSDVKVISISAPPNLFFFPLITSGKH